MPIRHLWMWFRHEQAKQGGPSTGRRWGGHAQVRVCASLGKAVAFCQESRLAGMHAPDSSKMAGFGNLGNMSRGQAGMLKRA